MFYFHSLTSLDTVVIFCNKYKFKSTEKNTLNNIFDSSYRIFSPKFPYSKLCYEHESMITAGILLNNFCYSLQPHVVDNHYYFLYHVC